METIVLLVSAITFIADLVTVGLFVRDLFKSKVDLKGIITYVVLIIVVFSFAFVLWVSFQGDAEILSVFGATYVIFGAVIFGMISVRFILADEYSFIEYWTYLGLIILITGLGTVLLYDYMYEDVTQFLAIPFMLVALLQIGLWIRNISSGDVVFDHPLYNFGKVFLFIIVGLLSILFLALSEW